MNKPKGKSLSLHPSSVSNNDPGMHATKDRFFEIRIKGQLSDIWADWFDGLSIDNLDDGEMLLSGYIVDQSALMGILNKLVRLNLALISMNEIKKP